MQPGGKPEPDESPVAALLRELEIEDTRFTSPEEPGDIIMAELTEHRILPAWRGMLNDPVA